MAAETHRTESSLICQLQSLSTRHLWIKDYICHALYTLALYKTIACKQVDILISKIQALQILYLKHHNNEYTTS